MTTSPVVVLLRGINLGGRNKLPMTTLRSLAAEAGLGNPRTHVQSGNLVVDSDLPGGAVGQRVRDAIADRAGLDVGVTTRTAAEWAGVVDRNPFVDEAAADGKLVHVVFLADEPGPLDVDDTAFAPETFVVSGREVYLSLPGGLGRSKLAAAVDAALDDPSRTTRNWNTVLAVARLLER